MASATAVLEKKKAKPQTIIAVTLRPRISARTRPKATKVYDEWEWVT